jgi:predicted TIM-barrel fold metal-dependent hydrolase
VPYIVIQVPNETFKAAAHLVVTGHRRKFPDIKIILAHLGGSTPFLASRVAVLSNYMGCSLNPTEILKDFQTKFYYETALSACEANLEAMQKFVREDHIIFGTDFPGITSIFHQKSIVMFTILTAVNKEVVNWYTENLQEYYSRDLRKLQGVMSSNVVKMFLGDS